MTDDIKKINSIPFLVSHPGEMLKDELEARGITQTDFAKIIGLQIRAVNEIIKGKRSISPEVANIIGAALGTSPDLWLGMQADFDIFEWQKKSKHKEEDVKKRSELYSLFPVSELIDATIYQTREMLMSYAKKSLMLSELKILKSLKKENLHFLEHLRLAI